MRNYKRKTERGLIPKTVMIQAAKEVLLLKKSNRSVANHYSIPRTTLVRFCSKIQIDDLKNDDLVKINVGYEAMKKVFSFQQEHDLINYINKSRNENINKSSNSNLNSGDDDNYHNELTGRQLRKFAYEYAVSLGIKYPSSWSNNQMAGPEWLSAFLRRHQELNVKRRSHCKQLPSNSVSCGNSTGGGGAGPGPGNIEELNVDTFLDNFKTILDDLKLTHHDLLKMGSNPHSVGINPSVDGGINQIGQQLSENIESNDSKYYLEAKPGCSSQVTDDNLNIKSENNNDFNNEADGDDYENDHDQDLEINKKPAEENVEMNNKKRKKSDGSKGRGGRKRRSGSKKKDGNDGDDEDDDKDYVARDIAVMKNESSKRTRQSTRLRNKKSSGEEHDEENCLACKTGLTWVQCNLCEVWVHDKCSSTSTTTEDSDNKKDILYLCTTCH